MLKNLFVLGIQLLLSFPFLKAEESVAKTTTGISNFYWFNHPEFQRQLDEETQSKAYGGNQVTLLINGVEGYAKRKINIEEADVILMKSYIFYEDETGLETVKQLLEKTKAGAKVFIQFDVKGFYEEYADLKAIVAGSKSPIPSHLQHFLNESKGNGFIIPTSTPFTFQETLFLWHYPKDHRKYLITWKYKDKIKPVKVIMGGMNTGDMYAFSGVKTLLLKFKPVPFFLSKGYLGPASFAFRDTDVEVMGPVVKDIVASYILAAEYQIANPNVYLQKELLPYIKTAISELKFVQQQMEVLKTSSFPNHIGSVSVRFIENSPPDQEEKNLNIARLFALMLKQIPSNEIVRMTSAQFLPTQQVEEAIITAANRGVKFEFLNNKSENGGDSDISIVAKAAHCRYRYLLSNVPEGTITFYDWQGNSDEGTSQMHQKVMSFGSDDKAPFVVGSSNLDAHSLKLDSEDLLLIQSSELKKQFDAMLQDDFSKPNSVKMTLQQLEDERLLDKMQECTLDWILHPVL